MTKTWENLRPASFRGVAFEVESHSESGGRRVELHEYPLRDTPYAEDLGKKAGKWQIEAFLVNGKSGYAERRDKTCDLVDCCPPSTQLKGATLAAVARSLAAPFGIEVVDETGVGVVPGFKTNPGDTVFETLEQLARAKGVLLTTDGRGRLVICRASKKKAATVLELGKNVFEGKGKFSMRDRFSSVTVIGQTAATETWNGKSASQQKTVVTDAAVPRHRPLVLVADQEHQGANKRAQWEVNVRYGKGNQATYTVYGWKDGDALWTPNVLVRIVDPFMGLEATWLVGSVGWTLDERGYRSELTLNPPEAFDVEPVSPKKGKKDKETFRWPGADTKES